ncbi:MAG: type II toxin-antitoxin system HicA family toxin [Fimbriimonadaceae bacterium]|nr:MAG: type II toxin-antitoxin system HicA family toxin [Fimbriimonadaceae bacterium]
MVSQRGSHRKWHNAESRLTVIVPLHRSKELPIGTLRQIMLAAQIPESEWQIL